MCPSRGVQPPQPLTPTRGGRGPRTEKQRLKRRKEGGRETESKEGWWGGEKEDRKEERRMGRRGKEGGRQEGTHLKDSGDTL